MKFKTKILFRLLFLSFFIFTFGVVQAQKDPKKRGPEYYEKKKEKDKDKAKDVEAEAKQRHIDIQSKETRKRMKRTEKKAKKHRNPKNSRSFFRRIFN